ncbi:MAG: hypothetical protein GQF41_0956 [Candidatus Rifleibacterium amylolyticum]|nr:MAG: hypothetical protein GQF41_0956 [Candidatus Rifleibacterium amylolyticum]
MFIFDLCRVFRIISVVFINGKSEFCVQKSRILVTFVNHIVQGTDLTME